MAAKSVFRSSWLVLGLFMVVWPDAVCAEDWRGFRGLEKGGRSDASTAPTEWSREQNVAWKTAIPGEGHSSPVVHGNDVVLTSAWPREVAGSVGARLLVGRVGLATLLVVLGGAGLALFASGSPFETRPAGRWLATAVVCGTAATFVVALILFGDHVLDFRRCVIRRWIGSSFNVALCLGLAGAVMTPGGVVRRMIGIAAVCFAVLVLVGVPARDHAYRGGPLNAPTLVMLTVGAVPAAVGIWLLVTRARHEPLAQSVIVDATAQPRTQAFANGRMRQTGRLCVRVLAAVCLAAGLVVATLAGGLLVVRASQYLTYHLGRPTLQPVVSWRVVYGLIAAGALACAAAVIAVVMCNERPVQRVRRHFRVPLAGVVLSLAALHFVEVNYASRGTTMTRGVVCLDRETGAIRWTCEALDGPVEALHRYNSPATPTPVVDDDHVVAYFGSAGMMCVSRDGRLRWTLQDLPYHSDYGVGTSPVMRDGVVVLACEQADRPYVAAIDARSGKYLWRADRPGWPTAVASGNSRVPLMTKVDGRDAVVLWGYQGLCAYELRSGKQIWTFDCDFGGDSVASPVALDDVIYLADPTRMRAVNLGPVKEAKPILASSSGSGREVESSALCWDQKVRGANCASPVVCDGFVFTVSDGGVVTCLDAETGRRLWHDEIPGHYYSSPVAAAGHVYFTNDQGLTTVYASADEPRIVAENDLAEPVYASHAAVDGGLLVRTSKHLYCIGAAR